MRTAPTRMPLFRFLRRAAVFVSALMLAGCGTVVFNASGDIARQQGSLIVHSTLLMLLIIVPVLALTGLVAWRYRQSNRAATYTPEWDHSTQLELVIWMVPLLIIIALGAITWISTHTLDPYRPLDRIDRGRAVASDVKPLVVDVVALDWKWLFIYPEQGIATVNEAAAPVDRPIRFNITASSVMNSFFIPAVAGQVYAMPGMQTQLHAVVNKAGTYEGFSANYSGAGFSHMRFAFRGVDEAGFEQWVAQARASGSTRSPCLPATGKTEREGARRLLRPNRCRLVRRDPQPLRRARHDVHEPDDDARHARQRRRRASPRHGMIARCPRFK
jgi:cytochrome o ubiquinol oxidase subunit 2